MKRTRIAVIALFLAFSCLLSPMMGESKSHIASKTTSPKRGQGKTSPKQNFYRELAKRRSNNRVDYPSLSDLEFANFRAVNTTGMGKGKLYRSSSPVNPWGNRNLIADNAARTAGIKTFVNIADTEKFF